MLQVYTKRKIHFKTVETPTATVVLAVLEETIGNETTYSQPKIVKIIKKSFAALSGAVAKTLSLSAPQNAEIKKLPILSPYIAFSSYTNSEKITGLFARPPTARI